MKKKNNHTLIGNPSVLKKVNRVRIMNYLYTHGASSRTRIADGTGLDRKTIINICEDLSADGLITTEKTVTKQRGRPPEVISINNDAAFAVGIDCGVQRVTGLVMDLGGNVRARVRRDYDVSLSKELLLKEVEAVITELLDTFEAEAHRKIKAISLCVPGLIDKSAGIAVYSSNIQGFKNVPIVDIIRKKFSYDVILETSNRAMTLAEMWFGGQTSHSFLCVHFDYGIGMGIVENGSLYRGANGRSGEIGHTIVHPGGKKCKCGRRGCLETVASGRALAEMASEDGVIQPGIEKATFKAVYEIARAGNTDAQKMLRQAGEYIGIAIANATDLFDPHEIVLNGDLVNAGDMLIEPLKEVVTQHSRNFSELSYQIKVSKIGLDASALGAAMLPLREYFEIENIRL